MTAPVLLLGFNRPELLARVIDRLREVRPQRVYLAVDGPRADRPDDVAKVSATRALVDSIDWTSEVHTLFRHENLGCGRAVSSAITWFFEQEEEGIILEDDILPDPTFFGFCDDLLERYRDDPRVFAISGCNFVPPEHLDARYSYRFARVPHIWGWATWRRAWNLYVFDLDGWTRRLPQRELKRAAWDSWAGSLFWRAAFEMVDRGDLNTWDHQFTMAAFVNHGLTATSNVNLVENIGFAEGSTHIIERPDYVRVTERMNDHSHPVSVGVDPAAEEWTQRHVFRATASGLMSQANGYVRGILGRTS